MSSFLKLGVSIQLPFDFSSDYCTLLTNAKQLFCMAQHVEVTKVVIRLRYQVVLRRPWAAQLSWHTDLAGWWPAHTGDCWSLWGRHRTLHLRGFKQSRSWQYLCWGLHRRSDVFTSGNNYIFTSEAFIKLYCTNDKTICGLSWWLIAVLFLWLYGTKQGGYSSSTTELSMLVGKIGCDQRTGSNILFVQDLWVI